MLKTHKPRGHFWTNPSVFQQSKEIRNIRLEDCTPPTTDNIGLDAEDDLPPPERARKRRKIEKLADDFLNGEPLLISCCRPTPTSLQDVVEWNQRSRKAEKWHLPILERPANDHELWVEAQDPWEALQQLMRKSKRNGTANDGGTRDPSFRSTTGRARGTLVPVIELEEAVSECKSVKNPQPKLSTAPSSDALRLAAAVRARNLQRAATEGPRISNSAPKQVVNVDTEPQSAPTSNLRPRPRYFRTRKPAGTEWLLRRNTVLHEVSPDESVDELGRTAIGLTPSRTNGQELLFQHDVDSEVRADCIGADIGHVIGHRRGNDGPVKSSADPLSLSFSQKMAAAAQEAQAGLHSSHTAENTDDESAPLPETAQSRSIDDNLTSSPKEQGVRSSIRASAGNVGLHLSAQGSTTNAGKSKTDKRATVTGIESRMLMAAAVDSSVPSGSFATEREADVATKKPQRNFQSRAQQNHFETTPIVFRKKRSSKLIDGTTSIETTAKQATKTCARSGGRTPQQKADQPTVHTAVASSRAPQLDLAINNDSCFGLALNMALVDKHMNGKLPLEPGSNKRSSAVKRALRKSMGEACAEFDRADEEPTSSQVDLDPIAASGTLPPATAVSAENDASEKMQSTNDLDERGSVHSTEDSSRQSIGRSVGPARRESVGMAQEVWPGTQHMLFEAQRDLFDPLEKSNAASGFSLDESPEATRASTAPPADSIAGLPSRELSQEQLPSTQAMMNTWSPWTAMKKPRIAQEFAVAAPSPSAPTPLGRPVNKQSNSARQNRSTSKSAGADCGRKTRRSGLRFSTTNNDIPGKLKGFRLEYPVAKSSSQSGSTPKQTPSTHQATPNSTMKRPSSTREHQSDETPLPNDSTALASSASLQQSEAQPPTETISYAALSSFQAGQGHLIRQQQIAQDHARESSSFEPLTSFDVDLEGTLQRQEPSGDLPQGSLDRTINDLTRDVLAPGMQGLGGPLSL
ncbi:hypothetical protein B0A50_00488 [Salinomyces thailandicus]|uniref:Uncharacterized protein n=1 Tax=Salinomyces thailandicus TaxID=706561 RepID=A0A4U0UFG7_9PEZI|nr:hypothetical protein B0A50_00488 [Salinomyces thailandica]